MAVSDTPWESAYPPGLRVDAVLSTWPVGALLVEAAAEWGAKPAIVQDETILSYRDLHDLAVRTAHGFAGLGLAQGDRVALLLPNTPYHPVVFFGAMLAGLVVVHLSPLDPDRVLAHKLSDSGARLLVTTDLAGLDGRATVLLQDGLVDRVIVGDHARWSGQGGEPTPPPPPSAVPLPRYAGEEPSATSQVFPSGEGEEPAALSRLLASRAVEEPAAPPRILPRSRGTGTAEGGGGGANHTRLAESGILSWPAFLAAATDAPLPAVSVDDLALLQYTGGTTGLPKAAMLTHANLSAAVSAYDLWSDGFGLTRRGVERVLLYLPLFHIYGLTAVLLRSLRSGQTIELALRFDPKHALDRIEAGATALPGVPTMWIAMMAEPDFDRRDLSSLYLAASGGAPMPAELARRFTLKTGLELLGGWGMSETSPAGTNLPKGRPEKIGSIGIPMPGIRLRVVALDDPRRALEPGRTGELAVRGLNVTAGYLNRPEENAAAFVDGWFLTGDIGFMDADGFFTIVDRKKDMIISGGFNIYPQMIEQAIYEHQDVEEALVIGIPDAYRGEAAKAFVKLRAGAGPLTLDALRDFLKPRLGPHELPAALEIRPALPRTPVGKLSKLELKQDERARAAREQEGTPPHA